MKLGDYELQAQIGAGRDGVAYRAYDPRAGELVEVRVLNCDAERRQVLARRLQLAALLDHPAVLGVRALELRNEPPSVVLEWLDPSAAGEEMLTRVPWSALQAVAFAHGLAEGLAAAHRLGLDHGSFGPGAVRVLPGPKPKLDLTGIDTVGEPAPGPLCELAAACRAPAAAPAGVLTGAADVYGLGVLLTWLLTGRLPPVDIPAGSAAALPQYVQRMLAADPVERLSAQAAQSGLASMLGVASGVTVAAAAAEVEVRGMTIAAPPGEAAVPDQPAEAVDALLTRGRLGRFRLLRRLGQGGMGAVYQAEDPADGATVAIKVLRADWASNAAALRRFHKEARLLAEVNNPHVTNLLEVNEDDGIHYLVMEFVAGISLAAELARRGRLDEPAALAILADVARALVEAHERGIVHRDVKPDNVLLKEAHGSQPVGLPEVKLSDFGLARHVVESESLNVTRAGAVVGTPYYMAPEQASGAAVDARVDVYAMGATLFHLLAGRPPFVAADALAVLALHRHEPPPPLQKLNPEVSDGTARLVERLLAKLPEARPPNAAAVLRELERLRRGEAADVALHPRLPQADPRRVVRYEWTWELESPPRVLWPYVCNTERLNRAVGLPAVSFTAENDPAEGVRRFGEVRKLGLTIAYREHPFEWVEGRRMGVLREFTRGPFKWLVSMTEMTPRPAGGTVLTHTVLVEPHGLLGRTAAAVEIGLKGRRGLDRVYRRMDAALAGRLGPRALVDPFEEPPRLSAAARRRLEAILDTLSRQGVEPAAAEKLGAFLAQAPAQEVARIRPLALARRLGVEPGQLVAACLHGARAGLLLLLWDILCPVCRIPSEVKDTLRALREHGHCDACNLDFDLDFANSVEMIFRAHPEIRTTELGVYCIGGPAHSPHVVAQLRLAAGERVELELALEEGNYRLRGPQLPHALDFRVGLDATFRDWDVRLGPGESPGLPRALRSGGQVLALANAHDCELVVRIERTAARADALTAARAASLALFRDLFPGEVLSPGQLVSVATVTFLVTALDGAGNLYEELGDARAFARIHEQFRLLEERIRRAGGALVKTIGEGVLAAFSESSAAVEAALDLQGVLASHEATRGLRLRVGVHRGPAMAATINDHLDYFGSTVSQAQRLPQAARGAAVVMSGVVAADPCVAALLRSRGLQGELLAVDLPGVAGCVIPKRPPETQ